MKISVRIGKGGTLHGILPDDIEASRIGRARVTRLSDVEYAEDVQGWVIFDRTRRRHLFKGKLIAVFKTRAKALAYERKWMEAHPKDVARLLRIGDE
jgi:hypothetical protein